MPKPDPQGCYALMVEPARVHEGYFYGGQDGYECQKCGRIFSDGCPTYYHHPQAENGCPPHFGYASREDMLEDLGISDA